MPKSLIGIALEKHRGPSPSFSSSHLILSFISIGRSGRLGRQALAREVGLGEGAVRTILKRLKSEGYITIIKAGCSLTNKGARVYRELSERLTGPVDLEPSNITVGRYQSAVCVRGSALKIREGILQRDHAVKAGALGATTYVIKGSKFTVPGGSADCEADYPSSAWHKLRELLNPKDGDVVIVCGSDEKITSAVGALSAALTLL